MAIVEDVTQVSFTWDQWWTLLYRLKSIGVCGTPTRAGDTHLPL